MDVVPPRGGFPGVLRAPVSPPCDATQKARKPPQITLLSHFEEQFQRLDEQIGGFSDGSLTSCHPGICAANIRELAMAGHLRFNLRVPGSARWRAPAGMTPLKTSPMDQGRSGSHLLVIPGQAGIQRSQGGGVAERLRVPACAGTTKGGCFSAVPSARSRLCALTRSGRDDSFGVKCPLLSSRNLRSKYPGTRDGRSSAAPPARSRAGYAARDDNLCGSPKGARPGRRFCG